MFTRITIYPPTISEGNLGFFSHAPQKSSSHYPLSSSQATFTVLGICYRKALYFLSTTTYIVFPGLLWQIITAGWLQTRDTHSLTVLKARSLTSRLAGQHSPKGLLGRIFLLASGSCWQFLAFFDLWLHHSNHSLHCHVALSEYMFVLEVFSSPLCVYLKPCFIFLS